MNSQSYAKRLNLLLLPTELMTNVPRISRLTNILISPQGLASFRLEVSHLITTIISINNIINLYDNFNLKLIIH